MPRSSAAASDVAGCGGEEPRWHRRPRRPAPPPFRRRVSQPPRRSPAGADHGGGEGLVEFAQQLGVGEVGMVAAQHVNAAAGQFAGGVDRGIEAGEQFGGILCPGSWVSSPWTCS